MQIYKLRSDITQFSNTDVVNMKLLAVVMPPYIYHKESSMNLETVSENVIRIDEAVKASAAPNQQNETSVEAGVLPKVSISAASENVGTME